MLALSAITLSPNYGQTIPTGIEALDQIFGHDEVTGNQGFVKGKTVLFNGPSGTGKTRGLLAMTAAITAHDSDIITGYFTGEQDENALRHICNRTNLLVNERMLSKKTSDWPTIKNDIVNHNVSFAVIDSLPMIMDSFPKVKDEESGQYREMKIKEKMQEITDFVQKYDIAMVLVNHCNKDGQYKGTTTIVHLVDSNITLCRETIEEIDCVVFQGGKNRDAKAITRAFPFNGAYDFSTPIDVEEKETKNGHNNDGAVTARKELHRERLLELFASNSGELSKAGFESGDLSITGIALSGIFAILRDMTHSGEIEALTHHTGGRGKPSIIGWKVIDKSEETV